MKLSFFIAVLLIAGSSALADWGMDMSEVSIVYEGECSLFVLPDGSGSPFTEAQDPYGSQVDATIHLVLMNMNADPVANYPAEDIWLESADGGLVPCNAGSTADGNTDSNGHTSWVSPLRAGGFSPASCHVVVNGEVLSNQAMDLHFNSADINGDGVVNLVDVSFWAADYYGAYHYRSDFYYDGILNLSDLGLLALSLQSSCP